MIIYGIFGILALLGCWGFGAVFIGGADDEDVGGLSS